MGAKYSSIDVISCKFLDLPIDVLFLVFQYLKLHDLSSISMCCKKTELCVREYIMHQLNGCNLTLWTRFIESNENLLTEYELCTCHVRKKDDIIHLKEAYRILHSINYSKEITRISCTDNSVVFAHQNISLHYNKIYDERIGRHVIHVDRVRFLAISHSMKIIKPGKYLISIRLRMEDNFTWPHLEDQPTEWSLKGLEAGPLFFHVYRDWWTNLYNGKAIGSDLFVEEECKWLKVTLPEVVISEGETVTFDIKDVLCNFWKGGLSFDFIEYKLLL